MIEQLLVTILASVLLACCVGGVAYIMTLPPCAPEAEDPNNREL